MLNNRTNMTGDSLNTDCKVAITNDCCILIKVFLLKSQ